MSRLYADIWHLTAAGLTRYRPRGDVSEDMVVARFRNMLAMPTYIHDGWTLHHIRAAAELVRRIATPDVELLVLPRYYIDEGTTTALSNVGFRGLFEVLDTIEVEVEHPAVKMPSKVKSILDRHGVNGDLLDREKHVVKRIFRRGNGLFSPKVKRPDGTWGPRITATVERPLLPVVLHELGHWALSRMNPDQLGVVELAYHDRQRVSVYGINSVPVLESLALYFDSSMDEWFAEMFSRWVGAAGNGVQTANTALNLLFAYINRGGLADEVMSRKKEK
jgi:hypothetical protein